LTCRGLLLSLLLWIQAGLYCVLSSLTSSIHHHRAIPSQWWDFGSQPGSNTLNNSIHFSSVSLLECLPKQSL
jgi:hypothetical protein